MAVARSKMLLRRAVMPEGTASRSGRAQKAPEPSKACLPATRSLPSRARVCD